MGTESAENTRERVPRSCLAGTILAAVVGLALMTHSACTSSATYDEVTYLRIAAKWWLTGNQISITRMGSPLTFWKLQQAPTLAALDALGRDDRILEPEEMQARLLPVARIGALWIWLVAWGITTFWARRLYGPRAMLCAAWWFALSPNLLAHGALLTMETPLVATSAGVFFLFWRFLVEGRRRDFALAAALAGLAFSCKFTAVLWPPLLAMVWWIDLVRGRTLGPFRAATCVGSRMLGFVALMLAFDFLVTGGALLPLSHAAGPRHPVLERLESRPVLAKLAHKLIETPIPQDWVGFATQLQHQRSGGPSYLFGVRRLKGWWYYYFVAIAVKTPECILVLIALRFVLSRNFHKNVDDRAWILPTLACAFLIVTSLGSSRNYGIRYLLPIAPVAIVWGSALASRPGWPRAAAWVGVAGAALGVATIHPHELSYFNWLAGGPIGGRRILADSNLDWGQGLRALVRLQRQRPEFSDLTLYYFGDTEPRFYGVVGVCHVIDAVGAHGAPPPKFEAETRFVAVSASLQYGPWGPPGYFDRLKTVPPIALTDDTTIAIYRQADVFTNPTLTR